MTKEEYLGIYNIVGAAMEVHRELGRGMEEAIYQEALAIELFRAGISAEREKPLHLTYKGQPLKKFYIADFYCDGVIVELKSVASLLPEHRAQLFNYMRITGTLRGILVNFGEKSLRAERYLYLPAEDDFVLVNESNYRQFIENK